MNTFVQRRVLHKDGTVVYFEVNAKKCDDDHILVIARNIMERRQLELNQQRSEANLKTILNNTDTIYVLLDKEFLIVSFNACAREFAERELGQAFEAGEYFLDYFPESRRSALAAHLEEALTGRRINYTVNYPQPENKFTWYNVRLFPISQSPSEVYGVMMEVSDITVKVVLEQKLEEERIRKQQEITEAVIFAEEKERQQIGQELHDNVNQLLATARLYIKLAVQTEMKKQFPIISKADKLIDSAINEIRNLSHSLITPFLEEYGLVEAIDHLAGTISSASMVPIIKQVKIQESTMEQK